MLPEFQRNESNLGTLNANRWGAYETGLNTNYNNAMNGLGANEIALRGDLDNQVNTVMGGVDKLRSQVAGGYDRQRADVMGLMEGMGESQKRDIRQNYADAGARTQQALADSGMGNTTVGAQMGLANTAAMNKDLAAADEATRTAKSGMLANLTGNALASQQNLGQYGTSMQSDLLGNRASALASQADANWGRRADLGSNLIESRNAMGLEQAQMADAQSQSRQAFAQQYAGDYANQLNNNWGQWDSVLRNIQVPYSQNTGQAMTMEGLGGMTSTLNSAADRQAQMAAARQQASATKTAGVLGAVTSPFKVGVYKQY